jgi:transcription elongation factor GreA
VKFLDVNEEETYTILGTTESDPLNGKISNESPLAAAILNAKVGDQCEVNVKNPYSVEVIDIK